MTAGAVPAVAFGPQASYLDLYPRCSQYLLKFNAIFLHKMIGSAFGYCIYDTHSEFSGNQPINPGLTPALNALKYWLKGKELKPSYVQHLPNIYGPAANQLLNGAIPEFKPPHQFYSQKFLQPEYQPKTFYQNLP
ncbi:MAG: hypothetical protein EZS28_006037, partial [Streblomastix strix]